MGERERKQEEGERKKQGEWGGIEKEKRGRRKGEAESSTGPHSGPEYISS